MNSTMGANAAQQRRSGKTTRGDWATVGPAHRSPAKKWSWKGCKPNSVPPPCGAGEHHSSLRPVPGTRLLSQHRRGQRQGSLFGLTPGEVFHAPSLTLRAVGSYSAFSPLPRPFDRGGMFSVALSVAENFRPSRPRSGRSSPAFAVRNRFPRPRTLRSSDFPPAACATSDAPPFQDRGDAREGGRGRQAGRKARKPAGQRVSRPESQQAGR